jgi:class 3 adenylate cyclase/tetratricopeptide (TPR) repeat protein
MKCPKCQFDNEADAKFCVKCGSKLEIPCPECGKSNRLESQFCKECGHNLTHPSETPRKELSFDEQIDKIQRYLPKGLTEKILSQRQKIEGERKQVTVMFCDMEGYSQLSGRLGPEHAYDIMDQVYEILIHKVHDYEGTVNEMTGDGIMALFGAPIALEDAPQRAIRSAYSIHREMAKFNNKMEQERGSIPPVKMRIGIHSGPVVVGTLGNDLRVEFKAVGDTVNLASRMEGLAEPGTTYVTGDTFSLTEGLFRFEALGEREVKGKEEPIKIYRVIAPSTRRTRFDVSAEGGLTPLVGRERELELLLNGFERVKGGRGQAFSIMAEAGVGKSRLLYEFRKAIANEDVTFLEGKCLSYSRGAAYHPLIDVLKSNFDVGEEDGDSEITEKLKRGLKTLGADEASTLPYLLELFSVKEIGIDKIPMSPEEKKDRIIEAVKEITVRGSEIRPLIIAVEDLHWVDKSSEEYLKKLLDSLSGARVFLIFTYRPDFVHTWGGRSYHSQVNLNRLSNQESLHMVSHLLGAGELAGELEELILEKTEGIPFFIEEFIKSLKDLKIIESEANKYHLAKDIQNLVIPATIQDVIMARVDSLTEGAKEVLQTGSVIEREFGYELIKEVSGFPEKELLSHLSLLKDSELLYERGIYPESTYIFKHALTQVVAYDSLLERRRQELHKIIGQAIEELYANRLAEQYEVLAYHFAKGEEWAKALEYFCKAGEKAAQTFANREAVALYDQALEAARHLGDTADIETLMAIHQAKVNFYFVLSDFESSRVEGQRLLALARRVGDRVTESVALASMGKASLYAHDLERALAYSNQALEVAEAADAKLALSGAYYIVGATHAVRGEIDLARKRIDQALTVSQSGGDVIHHGLSLYYAGLLKNWEGEYTEALHSLSDALRIASEHNLSAPLLQCLWVKGLALTGKGAYDEARLALEEGLAFSKKVGDEIWGHRLLNSLGWLYGECGDLERALDLNRRAAMAARKRGDPETIANSELNLGDTHLAQGDLVLAEEFFDGVYHLVRDPATSEWMRWRYSMHLFASLGELWLTRGDHTKAQEFANQCLEIATRTNSRKYLVKGWRLKGEIAFARRQWEESKAALQNALTTADAISNPTQLWKTHLAMGCLHTEAKTPELARQAYHAAREVINNIKGSLQDPGLHASFESYPPIRQIFDLSGPD